MNSEQIISTALAKLASLALPVAAFRAPNPPPALYILAFPDGIQDSFTPLTPTITRQTHTFQVEVTARAETEDEAHTLLTPYLVSVPTALESIPGPTRTRITRTTAWRTDRTSSWYTTTFHLTVEDYTTAAFPFSDVRPVEEILMPVYPILLTPTENITLTEPPDHTPAGTFTWTTLGSFHHPNLQAFKVLGFVQFRTAPDNLYNFSLHFNAIATPTPNGWMHYNYNFGNAEYSYPRANAEGIFAKAPAEETLAEFLDTSDSAPDLQAQIQINHDGAQNHIVRLGRNGPPPMFGDAPLFQANYEPLVTGLLYVSPLAPPSQ